MYSFTSRDDPGSQAASQHPSQESVQSVCTAVQGSPRLARGASPRSGKVSSEPQLCRDMEVSLSRAPRTSGLSGLPSSSMGRTASPPPPEHPASLMSPHLPDGEPLSLRGRKLSGHPVISTNHALVLTRPMNSFFSFSPRTWPLKRKHQEGPAFFCQVVFPPGTRHTQNPHPKAPGGG